MVAKSIRDMPILSKVLDMHGKISDDWRGYLQQVSDALNRTAPANSGSARQVAVLTLGASPYTYRSNYSGDVRIIVAGGTGVTLQFSRDGTTFYNLGVVAGQITLSQGDYLKITYTVAPSVEAVPA